MELVALFYLIDEFCQEFEPTWRASRLASGERQRTKCCRMSLSEILDEIPKLSFAERQELVRRAIALDEAELTPEENALLDARVEDFRQNPDVGVPLEGLKEWVRGRLPRR